MVTSVLDEATHAVGDDEFLALLAVALIHQPLPGTRTRTVRYLAGLYGADELAAAQDVLLRRGASGRADHAVGFAAELLEQALKHARVGPWDTAA